MRGNTRYLSLATALVVSTLTATVGAQGISVNFSENSGNQGFTGGQLIGPLGTDSANWNNTNGQPDLAAGSLTGLVDDAGANTGASMTWSAFNPWYNGDGTADDEHKMAVGYLDDGAPGVSIEFSNIPYSNYRVYGLLASDQGAQYDTLDFTVNGSEVFGAATTAPAYGSIGESMTQTGSFWSHADGTTRGNYWTFDTTGSTLTISGLPRNGSERGSITGLIVRDLSVPIYDDTMKLTVNRDNGNVTLENNTGAAVNIAGLGITSEVGTLNAAGGWNSISGHYDASSNGGNQSVSSDEWTIFAETNNDLSEATLGTGTIAQGQSVDLGSVWLQYPTQDVKLEYLDANTGETISGLVEYGGSHGALQFGDYNGDGAIDLLDWPTQRDNYGANLAGLSVPAAYAKGDFNGDGKNDLEDQVAFKAAFLAANPGVSVSVLAGAAVPEPTTLGLLLMAGTVLLGGRRLKRVAVVASLMLGLCLSAAPAMAQNGIGVNFRGGRADDDPAETGPDVTGVAGVVPINNWNNVGGNFPATDHNATVTGLLNSAGSNSGASITWATGETYASTGNFAANPSADQDRNLTDGYIDTLVAAPTNTAQLNNIPYAAYDLYVYVGSDGDGRTGNVKLNGDPASARWFSTYTADGTFNTAADYHEATAATQADAAADATANGFGTNYVVYRDLIGPSAMVSNTRGSNNTGMNGIQIVENLDPQVLTLQVNTDTGFTTIKNDVGATFNVDFLEVSSSSSSLDSANWSPLSGGVNDGLSWDVLGTPSDGNLAQFWLGGNGQASDVVLASGGSLSLGQAYDGSAEDLIFTYHDTNLGARRGLVEYVTGSQPGDFNGDLKVNGSDFLAWQRGYPGTFNASDLAAFQSNYGVGVSASASTSAVPEPSSLALLGLTLGGLAMARRKRNPLSTQFLANARRTVPAAAALVATLLLYGVAGATVTLDRNFEMGEGAAGAGGAVPENGVAGSVVGSGVGNPAAGATVDSEGPSGAYLGLDQTGNPVYANVTSGTYARAGATSGETGILFDGNNQYLTSDFTLNRPEDLNTQLTDYPRTYTGLTVRGLQLWVYPDSSALGNGRQTIVEDTNHAGGVAITADGKWTQISAGHDNDSDIGATANVVGNTWHHVMQHLYTQANTDNFKSVVYVDGMAVSANDDTSDTPVGSVLSVGAQQTVLDGTPPTVTYSDFFKGALDNLEMYVYGDNTANGGQDWGTFNLFTDNEWIANEIATNHPGVSGAPILGDLDLDGDVDDADVSQFVSGWRKEKSFAGAHSTVFAGDFQTWGWGDTNSDGKVNFSDWYNLRANYSGSANLNLGALLAAVPEPATFSLLLLGVASSGWMTRRRRA